MEIERRPERAGTRNPIESGHANVTIGAYALDLSRFPSIEKTIMRIRCLRWMVASGVLAYGATLLAADITGAGATFPYPIYAKWAEAYKAKTASG